MLRNRSNILNRSPSPLPVFRSLNIFFGKSVLLTLVALAAGGTWGLIEALRKPSAAVQSHNMLNPGSASLNAAARAAADGPNLASATAANASYTATRQSGRLFLNSVLNHVTRRGPFLGNSAGVLAMTYNLIDAYIPFFAACCSRMC